PETAETPAVVAAEPETPVGKALKAQLESSPDDGSDEERKERAALIAFYAARAHAPLWLDDKGFNADADGVAAEFGKAGDWGLDPADFTVPKIEASGDLAPEAQAEAE